jgi:hypothetical protein
LSVLINSAGIVAPGVVARFAPCTPNERTERPWIAVVFAWPLPARIWRRSPCSLTVPRLIPFAPIAPTSARPSPTLVTFMVMLVPASGASSVNSRLSNFCGPLVPKALSKTKSPSSRPVFFEKRRVTRSPSMSV